MRALIVFAIFSGIILLQLYLSRSDRTIPGLILPILSFVISFLFPLNLIAGSNYIFLLMAGVFLLANIPTMIFLAIYFAARGKARKKKQLDKLNIQDL